MSIEQRLARWRASFPQVQEIRLRAGGGGATRPSLSSGHDTARASQKEPSLVPDGELRVLLVVDVYREKVVREILVGLHALGQELGLRWSPTVVSAKEIEVLDGLADEPRMPGESVGEDSAPYHLRFAMPELREQEVVRAQMLQGLAQLERALHRIKRSIIWSGIESAIVARQLQLIFSQMVGWSLILDGELPQEPAQDVERFQQLWCREFELFDEDVAALPLRLEAHLQRQRTLALLFPTFTAKHDHTLSSCVASLSKAVRVLRRETKKRLTTPRQRRRKRRLWGAAILLLLLVVAGGVAWELAHPPIPMTPLAKFSHFADIKGITGRYYEGRNFQKFMVARTDKVLNMKWTGRPSRNVPYDHFSVRWKGYLRSLKKGDYQLCLTYDDGARMWINGKRLINDWRGAPVRVLCRWLHLPAGWYKLKVELFEHSGPAQIALRWRTPGSRKLVSVPTHQLCCRLSDKEPSKRRKPAQPAKATRPSKPAKRSDAAKDSAFDKAAKAAKRI